jgi:hypothetical protein
MRFCYALLNPEIWMKWLARHRCDVDEVFQSISPEEFLYKYALASRPLAIRGINEQPQ